MYKANDPYKTLNGRRAPCRNLNTNLVARKETAMLEKVKYYLTC